MTTLTAVQDKTHESDHDTIHNDVRDSYAAIAKERTAASSCCGPSSCCGGSPVSCCGDQSSQNGYSAAELSAIPEDADLGLGCGNPQVIASLQPGEIVLDLGSGGGIDVFLAARQVGAEGMVYGIDMTDEMLELARRNAKKRRSAMSNFAKVRSRTSPLKMKPSMLSSLTVSSTFRQTKRRFCAMHSAS